MKKDHILVYLMTSESDRVMKIEGSNISAAKKPERQLLEALGRQEACTHKVKRGLCKTTILSGLHHLGFAAFCGAISTGMNSYEAAKTEDTPTKVTYQIVKGQLAVTVGDEEPIMHSLDCSRWTPDQISYMKLLWAKDNHWITKNIKLPAVVLTKLLKDTITPEQKVINLIRKELGQAFVENDEGKLVHAIAKPFVDVEMRKDQGMKFFGKYEKHNIEYDPGCGIWRVEHEKEGKYTHNFEIKKFEFGFDKMQNVRKATVNNEAPPFIRIFPISMTRGKWAPEERHIILKTPDGRWLAKTSGTMRFVRLILGNNQIAGCFKDHSKNELSEKVESTYAELCEFLGLDYKGHPALRLVDRDRKSVV